VRDPAVTRDQVLRAIYCEQQAAPDGIVRTSGLAARLGIRGPSVTARLHGFAKARLIKYKPGQGAILTDEGERLARAAAARLLLIERFLAKLPGLPAECIPREAEGIARHVSDRVMQGIARYLGEAASDTTADATAEPATKTRPRSDRNRGRPGQGSSRQTHDGVTVR